MSSDERAPTSNEVGKFLVKDNAKIVEPSINREIIKSISSFIRWLEIWEILYYSIILTPIYKFYVCEFILQNSGRFL